LCRAGTGVGDRECIHQEITKNTGQGNQIGAETNERGDKMNRPSFKDFKKEALNQPGVKADYERLAPAYELRRKLIEIRLEAGFTQEQMADALKTQKSNISRLENVNSKISPKLSTIERYANAAGYRLEINFVPEPHSSSR
jgi:DNA-binding XRE family transcriptional regulator